ncbi:MAG: hypothetical protein R3B92_03250 [Patescibacteria group bacterium]|uniref:Uncharacterized protein n=1 Tax=candidate division WWE3 bacterium TaxID=2053526 RepID=A0A955EBQ7_UNCKA|nr:hypothetical protein [candidate division WWE3 bacterium]
MFNLLKLLFNIQSKSKVTYVSAKTEALIKKEWETISHQVQTGTPSHLRQALIMADKALDTALKDLAEGTTMAERLKIAKPKFDYPTYDKIWKAHKVRNNLVHEAGYEPPHYVLKEAIDNLKKGLQSLNVRI